MVREYFFRGGGVRMIQLIEIFLLLLNVVEQLFDVHGLVTKKESKESAERLVCSLSDDEILEIIEAEVADRLADLNSDNDKGA